MFSENEIRELIVTALKRDELADLPSDTAFADAEIDSLDFATVLLAIDEKLGVEIPDDAAERCTSIQSLLIVLSEIRGSD